MATTQERLQSYLDAERRILGGQSVRFRDDTGERFLQLPDLQFVQAQITSLRIELAREQAAAAGRGGRFSQADFGGRS